MADVPFPFMNFLEYLASVLPMSGHRGGIVMIVLYGQRVSLQQESREANWLDSRHRSVSMADT